MLRPTLSTKIHSHTSAICVFVCHLIHSCQLGLHTLGTPGLRLSRESLAAIAGRPCLVLALRHLLHRLPWDSLSSILDGEVHTISHHNNLAPVGMFGVRHISSFCLTNSLEATATRSAVYCSVPFCSLSVVPPCLSSAALALTQPCLHVSAFELHGCFHHRLAAARTDWPWFFAATLLGQFVDKDLLSCRAVRFDGCYLSRYGLEFHISC